ncbi:MAG: hypothetical protein K2J04_04530, partial [Lachnospiraceae bacterium]|nr:hypothetical protein [Lachnospiraceae bacterium]
MTEEQYKRVNGAIYPIVMVILGYIGISMLLWALSNGASWNTLAQLISSVIAMVIITAVYLTNRTKK